MAGQRKRPEQRAEDGEARGLSAAQRERASFFDSAVARSEYLSVRFGEALFLVKAEDQHVGRALYIKGGRGDIKLLARALQALSALYGPEAVEGRTFVDVGANIGTTTVSALLFHPLGRAVALEPEHENFVTLRLNLAANAVDDRAVAIPAAASSSVGTVELVVDPTSSGLHSVLPDDTLDERGVRKGTPTTVPSVTLDSLVDANVMGVDEVALVWIDAEHHEGSILSGATTLVEAGVPVLIEWDPEGLAPRGEDAVIEEIARDHYTHFMDMRGAPGAVRKLEITPVGELAGYTHPVHSGEGTHFTELLFLRLTARQAANANEALSLAKTASGEAGEPAIAGEEATMTEPPTGREILSQLRGVGKRRRRAERRGRKGKTQHQAETTESEAAEPD